MKTVATVLGILVPVVLLWGLTSCSPSSLSTRTDERAEVRTVLENALEKLDYVTNCLSLYDVEVRYHSSYGSEKLGIEFKLKNKGERTVTMVEVTVYLLDSEGRKISEQTFRPVGFTNPLKPNYVWQPEAGAFYPIENVPSEYRSYRAVIRDISLMEGEQGKWEQAAENERRASIAAAAERRARENASNALAYAEAKKKKDDEAKRRLFEYAKTQAQAGNAYYQRRLGEMYMRGEGTDVDVEQARTWIFKAWGNGDQQASNLWYSAGWHSEAPR